MNAEMTQITRASRWNIADIAVRRAPWVLFALLVIVPSLTNPNFRSIANLQGFLESSLVLTLLTVGETFVLLVAGIDLSVGAGLALGSVVFALTLSKNVGIPGGIAVTVILIALCGWLNGLLVAFLKIPSFIVTFGMMAAEGAVALIISGGNRIPLPLNCSLPNIVFGSIFNIPYETWILASLVIILGILLHYLKFFRNLYAVGSNSEAAKLSGVPVRRSLILAFTMAGLLSGIAAVFYTARIVSGDPLAGNNMNLEAIAAAVIGGVNLFGGRGSMVGAVLGSLIYTLITNVLNLYGVNPNIAELVGGFILVFAALMNVINARRRIGS